MIARYSRPEMARIWTQESKYEAWLKVELAVCEVYAKRGIIPTDALGRIKAGAKVDAARIDEIETRTRHDVIAFLTNLEESIGADSRHVHLGLTSSDVVDTAQALQLVAASELLLAGLERLRAALRVLALRHKETICVGRTHGIHAEPTSFGLKAALWFAEAGRNLERLRRAREAVRVGKISGAVGNFAHVEPEVEEEVCRLLGLEPAPISTQVVQRDRHAELCATLAIVAASLEKIATEIRSLQRTEIREAEEPFTEGQKGSSAMPHKRNPVACPDRCGDVGACNPDSTLLVDYMLHLMIRIIEGLRVYPERMRENLERSYGLMFSQRVLLRLAETGLPRQEAYEIVQGSAMRAWEERKPFRALLAAEPQVTARLSPADLDACFDPAWYLRNVDAIYRRAGLL